ncbi:carbonic anhydrase 1-like isoform X2 [Pseudomyrmex gracilis]|uniref:carbonic anhydrase 1-like isoform X2 n=1 Tax=Pseudomyrmex gracilis TaxID=219809 RepID=UPI000995713F|nr:carbonic anhydrase 1-like isoform X2 [Pseudomyrmex gracilis]
MDWGLLEAMNVILYTTYKLFLLNEIADWIIQLFTWTDNDYHPPSYSFGYAGRYGPHTWKDLYPESKGSNQSPINITTRLAVVVQPVEPLRWSNYNTVPMSMTIANDGHTVILRAYWPSIGWPQLQGGPLTDTYDFFNIIFHWGPSDEEGSEHTLDYVRYPMELQVLHTKRGIKSPKEAIALGAKDGLAIVSFFLQINDTGNPYLDHIVNNLFRIACPGSKIFIPPFPLEWIFAPFDRDYYTYSGSLSLPPCNEIVTWIVQQQPIAISSFQVEQFRKIWLIDAPLILNCRPVQPLNDRDVYFYEESIPRD